MMAEESETPGHGAEGRARPGEPDFLAERRARRATESGEAALQRRAEAAEATVETLERHVASLQQRLEDAESERHRLANLVDAERTHAVERESELRRVKQREYAEQQLRVEAEERLLGAERAGRDRLGGERVADERRTAELSERIESLQRQLSAAEQAADAERATLRRAERELQARVADLERRAIEIQDGLAAERTARERSELELASIREGHRRMEGLLGEVRGLVGRLSSVLSSARREPQRPPVPPTSPPTMPRSPSPDLVDRRGVEMADALAAAVERLRARALSAPPLPEDPDVPAPPVQTPEAPVDEAAQPPEPSVIVGESQTAVTEAVAAGADVQDRAEETELPAARRPSHKHSQSFIGRLRNRRKQRRGR